MANEAGPAPWNKHGFESWFKRKRTSGGKLKYETGYKKVPRELAEFRSITTGNVYKMPRQDVDELTARLGENVDRNDVLSQQYSQDGKQLYRNIQTPTDYIDFAFEKQSQHKNLVTQECKGGHILALTYNPLYNVLMVKFRNRNDIVVFFNLPANVATRLMYLAETDSMAISPVDGELRHAVGVEFWNLVRVRQTVHQTQYPFQYTTDFRTGEPFGRTPGTGPGGGPSKYIYREAEPQRKAFDKKTGEEIIRETVQVRERRKGDSRDYEGLMSNPEGFKNRLDIDDIGYYLEDGRYEKDIRKFGEHSAAAMALMNAKKQYDSAAVSAEDIMQGLIDQGVDADL